MRPWSFARLAPARPEANLKQSRRRGGVGSPLSCCVEKAGAEVRRRAGDRDRLEQAAVEVGPELLGELVGRARISAASMTLVSR